MDTERALAAPQPTGDFRVDDAIAGLAALSDLPLDEHPSVLEAVHDRLREILGELGPTAPGAGTAARAPRGAGPDDSWQQGQLEQQGHPGTQGQYGQQRR